MTVYLDCAATTPVEPRVAEELMRFTVEEFGNAGSRTHEFGARAKRRVTEAREQVAGVLDADPSEVIFTSGATEANNLAILGLAPHGEQQSRRHIVSTAIEHKAVLEPLEVLRGRGFEIELVKPTCGGWVDPCEVASRLREDTLLVSVMHVNNETGIVQPIPELAELLEESDAYFHVDAAQGFGKQVEALRLPRIDLLSVSGHKIYAPKGIGALVARRRTQTRPPLSPLLFGGGQERGLRAGTLPVGLVAALGSAAELSLRDREIRERASVPYRERLVEVLNSLGAEWNGDPSRASATTFNVSIPGLDSEAAIVALKDVAAISNGSACTSQSYEPSHVLAAMGISGARAAGAIRVSWSHLTPHLDWEAFASALAPFTRPRREALPPSR